MGTHASAIDYRQHTMSYLLYDTIRYITYHTVYCEAILGGSGLAVPLALALAHALALVWEGHEWIM